jgi:hypothetical protein
MSGSVKAVGDLTESLKKKGIDVFKDAFPKKIAHINDLLSNGACVTGRAGLERGGKVGLYVCICAKPCRHAAAEQRPPHSGLRPPSSLLSLPIPSRVA